MDQQLPIQPVFRDAHGVERFVANSLVRFLLDAGPYDMYQLAFIQATDAERAQFAQLIGYSVSGFFELSYVSDELCDVVQRKADALE